MSRPSIATHGKSAAQLFNQFVYANSAAAWVLYWSRIFSELERAPKDQQALFAQTPQPRKGTAFVLGEVGPTNYFAVTEAKKLLGKLKDSIASRDGTFFRELADAIEAPESLDDSIRAYLVTRFYDLADASIPPKQKSRDATARMIKDELSKRWGIQTDERTIRRACANMDIQLKPDKVGRPKKADKKRKLMA